MNDVLLKNNKGFHWDSAIETVRINTKGVMFKENNIVGAQQLVEMFSHTTITPTDVCSAVSLIDGDYAIVGENKEYIFAVVDKERSFPLFYVHRDGDFGLLQ